MVCCMLEVFTEVVYTKVGNSGVKLAVKLSRGSAHPQLIF